MGELLNRLLEQYLADMQRPPVVARVKLLYGEQTIGSLLAEDAAAIAGHISGAQRQGDDLLLTPMDWPNSNRRFSQMATFLRDTRGVSGWRNESVAVNTDNDVTIGKIERACTRVLGIRTTAVHLFAQIHPADIDKGAYAVWLQRRSASKATDPNMLDSLAAGMVAMHAGKTHAEAIPSALQREVHEEAGLLPQQYEPPVRIGRWRICRPVQEGYMVEDTIISSTCLHRGVVPNNLDGEVADFTAVRRHELLALIEAGELTQGAAICTLLCLQYAEQNTRHGD